jgi:hypothetical protein
VVFGTLPPSSGFQEKRTRCDPGYSKRGYSTASLKDKTKLSGARLYFGVANAVASRGGGKNPFPCKRTILGCLDSGIPSVGPSIAARASDDCAANGHHR